MPTPTDASASGERESGFSLDVSWVLVLSSAHLTSFLANTLPSPTKTHSTQIIHILEWQYSYRTYSL